ncbi:glycosyltransferase [Streptomyces sp. NPDC044571]|uniref:glycosyltransferase n=1 Tax=Streptomyces sp. NPDC044571 TaxID=3155371 RepID=UPI0033CB22C4
MHGYRRLPTVYVTGGAQGAQEINGVVRDVLLWVFNHANVIHQCGTAESGRAPGGRSRPVPSVRRPIPPGRIRRAELPDVLALARGVVSRSGAGTLAELTALDRPAVFMPLVTLAGNEQAHGSAPQMRGPRSPCSARSPRIPPCATPSARRATPPGGRRWRNGLGRTGGRTPRTGSWTYSCQRPPTEPCPRQGPQHRPAYMPIAHAAPSRPGVEAGRPASSVGDQVRNTTPRRPPAGVVLVMCRP